MSEKKEAVAMLDIGVFVNCPNCDFLIDLMNQDDTNNYDHNEEGHVLTQACPDGYWIDKHKEFEVVDVTCTECKTDFNVKGLDW